MAERHVFVARERELSELDGFLKLALAGQGQVCFVTGEAGSGKTALVTEFALRAQEQHKNLPVAVGRSDAQTGIGDPYLPFREALAMLTGDPSVEHAARRIGPENVNRLRAGVARSVQVLVEVAPELVGVLVPGGKLLGEVGKAVVERAGWTDKLELLAKKPAAPSVEQSRIFEQYTAYLQRLSVKTPLILLLDDLQWSDAASVELLFHLGRRIGESRVLIVGAYRPEEVALGRGGERHPLEKVLAEFKRYLGDIWVDLDQAEEAEQQEFVHAFLETEPNQLGEGFRQALYEHTGGHPLFTIELVRDMQERGDIARDEDGRWAETPSLDWAAVPARVEGVIEERIGRLGEELRAILSVASVEGQDFTAQVVGRVQEMGERQLLRELSQELEKRHRLVQERGEVQLGRERVLSRYGFAHALFQQYLYNDLSVGERRLLHREVAAVLEELYEGSTEQIAVQLARHFDLAGIDDKAIEYLLQVGDRARLLNAHQEAIDNYQRALALFDKAGDPEPAAHTLMKLGLTYHNAFDFEAARQAFEEGSVLWQQVGEIEPAATLPPAPHPLRIAVMEPDTLDPCLSLAFAVIAIDQLFSGLVELTPDAGVVPSVARSWEVSEGGCRYLFHLRDDVRWSDGAQVTAGDFEYAWKRVLDPAWGSPLPYLLYDIQGARAFNQGEVGNPDRVGVRALDDVTLQIQLEEPTSYFLDLLSYVPTVAVPRHVVEAHGEAWTDLSNIVTSGPFTLASWKRGESLVFERNSDYHGRFTGNLKRVQCAVMPGRSVKVLQMYEDNDLDTFFFEHLPAAEWGRARQRYADEYISGPELATYYIGLDVDQPPFDDPRVRRAFTLATDREKLAHVTIRGYLFPAMGGLVPPGMPGHSPGIGLPYDPEAARQLLAEAGYPGGNGFPTVECLAPEWYLAGPALKALEAQWSENLGVEITWETMEWARYTNRMGRRTPHMWLLRWMADYLDPDSFLRASHWRVLCPWQDEAYDQLVEGARRLTDQEERVKMYQQADRILAEEAPLLLLYYGRFHLLVKPWVKNYPPSTFTPWLWKDVIIEPH